MRLLQLLGAGALAVAAQLWLTDQPADQQWLAWVGFGLAAVLFVLVAGAPEPLRTPGAAVGQPWRRRGWLLSLAGLLVGAGAAWLLWSDLSSTLGLLLWPVATLLFVAGAWLEAPQGAGEKPAPPAAPSLLRRWELWALLAILVVAAAVRFYQLGVHPNGCQSDECNNGLDALKWLSGAPYMPYAETNEGQATLFTYLIALAFQIFGVGVAQMRFAAAAGGVLTLAAFYFLARDHYDPKAALAATALFAAARWHLTFSRIVYELILQPLAMILLFYFLLRALRAGRRRDWALAGVSLALGMNTYTAFRVVPFILAAYLLDWLGRDLLRDRTNLRQDLGGMAILAGGAMTAILPLGVYIIQRWDVFTIRMRSVNVFRDVEQVGSWQPIYDNLRKTLLMFNWRGDESGLNNLPGAPMLDTLAAALFVLGLAYCLWHLLRGRALPVLYVLWAVGIASLAVLSVAHEAPSARRTIGMLPLVYLLIALYADQLFRAAAVLPSKTARYALNVGVTATVVLVGVADVDSYFNRQAPMPAVWQAFSPAESAIGRFLADQPPAATVLVSPEYEHHAAIKLMTYGRPDPYQAFTPTDDIPYRGPIDRDLVYIFMPQDIALLTILQAIYPAGQATVHQDRYEMPLFLSFAVPQAGLAAAQGLAASYFADSAPGATPVLTATVASLEQAFAVAPVANLASIVLTGSVLAPAAGEYAFLLQPQDGVATLQIGAQAEYSHTVSAAGWQVGGATVNLAAGFHPVRITFTRTGATPGALQIDWSGPDFAGQPLGAGALYTVDFGNQGLVGSHYPNGDWQGEPTFERSDLIPTPFSPLAVPYSIRWRGQIVAPAAGLYEFSTVSDDGSLLYVNSQLVVDNSGSHGAQERQGAVDLPQGPTPIELLYNELGGSKEIKLRWRPPGAGWSEVRPQDLQQPQPPVQPSVQPPVQPPSPLQAPSPVQPLSPLPTPAPAQPSSPLQPLSPYPIPSPGEAAP